MAGEDDGRSGNADGYPQTGYGKKYGDGKRNSAPTVRGAGKADMKSKKGGPMTRTAKHTLMTFSTVSAKRFKDTFSRRVQVHFVGAWYVPLLMVLQAVADIHRLSHRDTVSSVVLPAIADGMNHVCYFRHALALDERRVKFLPEYVNQGLSCPQLKMVR